MNADQPKARVANIFDVARLAGVSHQTVSRVLNDGPNVRPATRQRVEDAIQQLRYRPSTAARALVTKRSRTIGLITTGRLAYGSSSVLLAFNDAARQARYTVSIASMVDPDPLAMRASVELLLGQTVEAIVLVADHLSALDELRAMDLTVPLVAVESSGRAGFHAVAIDQHAGARAATDHLVELGHRSILHIAGPRDSMDALERERGWRSLSPSTASSRASRSSPTGRPRAGTASGSSCSTAQSSPPCSPATTRPRSGSCTRCRSAASRAGQVSVVGFDDIPEAEHLMPPLTTVSQDFGESAATSWRHSLTSCATGPRS